VILNFDIAHQSPKFQKHDFACHQF